MIGPCDRVHPEEYSEGTSPTKEPIVDPVERCQSPISTAGPNLVGVDVPRRQHNRCTTSVNSDSAAIAVIV